MASLGSSLAPSPAPKSSDLLVFFKLIVSKKPDGQLLRIQLSVLATVVFLFVLIFLGSIRRRVHVRCWVKYLTKIIYILIPISITYIMGLMHNASTFHILYPFWACSLIYAYGGVVTMTACDFSDNEDTLPYFWRTLPLFFWTLWLFALIPKHTQVPSGQTVQVPALVLLGTLLAFIGSATLNTRETLEAFYIASKSKGLPFVVEPTVRYMREGRDVPSESAGANPLPMTRYRYVVWGDPIRDNDGITTTEDIWQSVGTRFLANCASKEPLKDLCLSYAFFKLILRRFADFPLHESSEPKTRRFIGEGLLIEMDIERVFHIIEVELQFLFDFFYTKSHICTSRSYGFFNMWHHVFVVGILGFFGIYGISLLVSPNNTDQATLFTIQFHGHSLEAGVTRVVILVFFLLESWKFIYVFFSNRKMVWRLCMACRRMATTNDGGLLVTRISLFWNVKDWFSRRHLFRFLFKPWQRQLGQYSFLESYTQVPVLARNPFSWFGMFVKIPRAGQVGEFSVELSKQVKEAIVASLLLVFQEAPNDQPVRLSRGRATIARHQLPEEISSACQLETDAHVILVWHIATCLCAHHLGNNDEHFLVATQLSKYCAYLVTFAPELLPGHPYTSERLFDMAVLQAKLQKIDFNMPQGNAYEGINMNNVDHPDEVVARGVALAKTLIPEVIQNPDRLWIFLAEFWAELLLYLAPSDNVAVHGEYLAKGGEFITHLWALLTHAGVVSRNCPPMVN